MIQLNKKVEVLAPVGSMESLAAALQARADAVYFGVEQLNMRAKASAEITINDLKEIAEKCDAQGVKKYVTLNSTVYDHDKNLYREIISACKAVGIDAIIATDFAIINEAMAAGVPVHISTQSNISNIEAVKFFARFSDLMVLSRELTLKQIEEITREIREQRITGPSGELVKIEVFVHGALCMAVSGKCYISLHSNNSSANRGSCIQNCRHPYLVTDKETGMELEVDNEYIMSAKDLCTIDFLDQIVAAGADVLKIEGRGRSADYVYTTVQVYKEALQAITYNTFPENSERWKSRLASVYNRGFWEGYYLGRKLGVWAETGGSKATKKKIYIAKGVKYFSDLKVGEFKLESGDLKVGDNVLIVGAMTGIVYQKVTDLHVDKAAVNTVGKGTSFSMPVKKRIRPSDKLYKLIQTEYAEDYVLPE
jgi:U32 family peptidase